MSSCGSGALAPADGELLEIARRRPLPATFGDHLVPVVDLEFDRQMPGLRVRAERCSRLRADGRFIPREHERGPGTGSAVPGVMRSGRDLTPVPVRAVGEATAAGVKVMACENTMKGQKLVRSDMLGSVGYVNAGVVEIMQRQQQGWSYLRP